jgi:hypothetical protein
VLDILAIVLTIGLAGATVVTTSGPVPGFGEFGYAEFLWPIVAMVWAAALLTGTRDRNPHRLAWLAIGVTLATILTLGYPLFLLVYFAGPTGVLVVAIAGLVIVGFVLLRQESHRRLWLVSPIIVVATLGLVVSGIPRSIRFSYAEPELSAYARQLQNGEATFAPRDDGSAVSVASMPIYEVRREGEEIIFITGYVGVLEDDGAGLAYVPSGTPGGSGVYQHLTGPWYSWSPY